MAQPFPGSVFRILDNSGNPVAGALVYTYEAGTTTPKAVYTDSTLAVAAANPVVADASGYVKFWPGSGAYKVRVTMPVASGGAELTAYAADGVEFENLSADLASSSNNDVGAGMVAYSNARAYPAGTVGYELLQRLAPAEDYTETRAIGTSSAGGNVARVNLTTVTGHSGGASDNRGRQEQIRLEGPNSSTRLNTRSTQTEVRHTAGTLSFAYGDQAYVRLGLAGSTTGNITTVRVFEGHVANEGSGTINNAQSFMAGDVDLIDGTGTIGELAGFRSQDLGHATRITGITAAFWANNMTGGAPTTAAFYTDMASGTGKYVIRSINNAPSTHVGPVRLGDSTSPADQLEVKGYAKLTGDGTVAAAGNYHELRTANNDFTVRISNKHASTPQGALFDFSAADPNNTTQAFIRCTANGTNRVVAWSNGDIQNQNNVYGSLSDARLKTDVRDAGSQWADVKAMRLRKFKLHGSGRDQLGFVAQELETTSPGLVFEGADGMKGVRYSVAYMKALGALQEAQKRIEQLEARLAAAGI